MRIIGRILLIVGVVWLVAAIVMQLRPTPGSESDPQAQSEKLFNTFLVVIFAALALGALVAFFLLPAIGDWVGSFFALPNERIEKGEYADALAFANQGDYEGAIAAYRHVLKNNPEDAHAVSEIVHLYNDKLHNHDAAAAELEEALQREWPEDKSAFLASRLVDVYWKYQGDADRARAILTQVIENMPETRHAANARHRLRDIEMALRSAGPVRPLGGAAPAPEVGGTDAQTDEG